MASTSELQKVRMKIEELEEEVKALEAQIDAEDPSARLALQRELIAPLQDQLVTLRKKEERLDTQLSAGMLQWWIKKLMAVLPTAAALGISESLAFTKLPWIQYSAALLCDVVLRLVLKFIVTKVHKRFTEWRRGNPVAAA